MIKAKEMKVEFSRDTYGYMSLGTIEASVGTFSSITNLFGTFELNDTKEFEVIFIRNGYTSEFLMLADLTNIPEEIILFELDELKEEASREIKKLADGYIETYDTFKTNANWIGSDPFVYSQSFGSSTGVNNYHTSYGFNTSVTSGLSGVTCTTN